MKVVCSEQKTLKIRNSNLLNSEKMGYNFCLLVILMLGLGEFMVQPVRIICFPSGVSTDSG